MSQHNETALRSVEGLIKLNEDGKLGYRNAAEHLDDAELKTIFLRFAQQRALFEEELKQDVRSLNGEYDPHTSGTVLGDVHRTWTNLRQWVQKRNDDAIIQECIRGERSALEAYSRSLDNKMPELIRDRVTTQLKMVEGAILQLEGFRADVSH